MSTKKTGWEALDKWVGDSPASTPAPAGGAKKTGWEALDKWVGDDAGTNCPSCEGSMIIASATETVCVACGARDRR